MIQKETITSLINSVNALSSTTFEYVEAEYFIPQKNVLIEEFCLQFMVCSKDPSLLLIMKKEVISYPFFNLEEARNRVRYNVLQSLISYALLGEGGNMVTTTKEINEQRRTKG